MSSQSDSLLINLDWRQTLNWLVMGPGAETSCSSPVRRNEITAEGRKTNAHEVPEKQRDSPGFSLEFLPLESRRSHVLN